MTGQHGCIKAAPFNSTLRDHYSFRVPYGFKRGGGYTLHLNDFCLILCFLHSTGISSQNSVSVNILSPHLHFLGEVNLQHFVYALTEFLHVLLFLLQQATALL